MARTRTAVAVGAALAVVASSGVVATRLLFDDEGDRVAAAAFAQAWTSGTLAALPWAPASGPDPAGQVAALTAGLTAAEQDRPEAVEVTAVRRDGDDRATAELTVRWDVGAPWSYPTRLPLVRADDGWRPVLAPEVVHPDLTAGSRLRTRSEQPPRAAITDRTGAPIVVDRPVVTVGLQPRRTTDLAGTVRTVAELLDVDAGALQRQAAAAGPEAFVEVVTLRRPAYDALRDRIRPVPGVVLREGVRQLAPTAAFARALLGAVGPATAEAVEAGGGRVRAGQDVGLSGLQRRFDEQLAGTPGLTVEAVDDAGTAGPPLLTEPAAAGTALQLTLDPAVQLAADAALEAAPDGKAAAMVVLQPSTGDVLAVANAGPDGPGADRALTGRYPPGSTFKVASTLAFLREGLTPEQTVACPATATVQGKRFRNAEDEVLGDQPFRVDFAQSCNTAFVGLAPTATSEQLAAAARDLGYAAYDLGIGAAAPDVPVTDDPVTHAAQVIGQGQVLVSPLSLAVSAATVAAGRLRPPRLLASTPAVEPGPTLPEAAALQELTRLVVTQGTGTALAGVAGEPVRGKTGTAEFGTDVPPRTHAWFTGSSGDLAFAVLVEDGGFGGQVAAPLAARFLTGLRG